MEQLSGIQEQLNQIVEGQQLNVFAEGGAAVGVGAAAAGIVVGLLICFFGLKLVKFLGALVGFFVGALIGAVIALVAGAGRAGFCRSRSGGRCDPGGAFLVFVPDRRIFPGVSQVLGIASSILQPQSVVLTRGMCRGGSGGCDPGCDLCGAVCDHRDRAERRRDSGNQYRGPGRTWGKLSGSVLESAPVIAVIGIIVQFMMHSRRVGKKEKNFSEQVKEQDSMESEVEKMASSSG